MKTKVNRKMPSRRLAGIVSIVFVLVAAGVVGARWWAVRSATLARNECVSRVEAAGGHVTYQHQYGASQWDDVPSQEPPQDPIWRQMLFGTGSRRRIHSIRFPNGEALDHAVLNKLRKLREVRGLFLQGTLADDKAMAIVADLQTLETLVLNSTRVTDSGLSRIASLKRLKVLNIDGIDASDESLATIGVCRALEHVSCVDTHVTSKGIRRLRERLPKLHVEWGETNSDDVREAANHLERMGFYVNRRYDMDAEAVWYSVSAPFFGLATPLAASNWRGSKTDFELLQRLRRLRRLNLDMTVAKTDLVDDDVINIVSHLLPLRDLSIRNSSFSDSGLEKLQRLGHLQQLDVSGTQITNHGLMFVGEMPRMTSLTIARTSVDDEGLIYLKSLGSLNTLDLSHTGVTDNGMRHVAGLTSLKKLRLAGTAVGDGGLRRLRRLSRIEVLDLSDTQITDASCDVLRDLRTLKELWLNGTKLSTGRRVKLRETLPDCLIR